MAKKSFKENPALQFITAPTENETPLTPPPGYKLNPLFIETRSKRLQLVVQPSLLERVKEQARQRGISTNEYIHQILDEATKGE